MADDIIGVDSDVAASDALSEAFVEEAMKRIPDHTVGQLLFVLGGFRN